MSTAVLSGKPVPVTWTLVVGGPPSGVSLAVTAAKAKLVKSKPVRITTPDFIADLIMADLIESSQARQNFGNPTTPPTTPQAKNWSGHTSRPTYGRKNERERRAHKVREWPPDGLFRSPRVREKVTPGGSKSQSQSHSISVDRAAEMQEIAL